MRSAILRELPAGANVPCADSHPLGSQELATPHPRAGEVGVDITFSSLCHSDLAVINGSRPRPLPMALGHEAVGPVASLGEGIRQRRWTRWSRVGSYPPAVGAVGRQRLCRRPILVRISLSHPQSGPSTGAVPRCFRCQVMLQLSGCRHRHRWRQ